MSLPTNNGKRTLRKAVKTPDALSAPNVKIESTPPSNLPRKAKVKKGQYGIGKIIGRVFIMLGVVLALLIYVVYSTVSTIATGPSVTMRDQLVLMAMQASATKWVPGLFLPKDTVEQIVADSKKINTEVIALDDYVTPSQGDENESVKDPFENAIDGMLFETISGKTYKAYVLLVKDPSRIFVGTSSDYKSRKPGMDIFNIAKKYNAVAAINGGEFSDPGGVGDGSAPLGITYSKGELVWNDGYTNRTFIGIDKDNNLVVSEGMTKTNAQNLNIRDGVCFQNGNVLITNENGELTLHRADSNTGTAQRTAIGQRADGTMILLVTDGRTASSIGATHNDVIDIMVNYGAVTAGMLDGGSSSMMYYENYFEKYDYDKNELDQYQLRGLVNKYKAFTKPRSIPTFFIVGGEQ